VFVIFHIEKASVPFSIALAFIAGIASTSQATLSGHLANELNDGIMAALISNIGGAVCMSLFLFNTRVRNSGKLLISKIRNKQLPLWQLSGGAFGAIYIATAASAVSVIGTGLFTVVLVASQNFSSIVADKVGFGSGIKRKITPQRLIAAVLGIIAVLLSVSGFTGKFLWIPIVAIIFAGFAATVQFSINGKLTQESTSEMSAFINFPMSMLVVSSTLLIMKFFGKQWPTWPEQWWMYFAGCLGAVVVFLAAATIKTLGVLLFGLASVTGSLITSLGIDIFAPAANVNVGWALISGAGLMIFAVYLASELR